LLPRITVIGSKDFVGSSERGDAGPYHSGNDRDQRDVRAAFAA
jgi:hypothetical protein